MKNARLQLMSVRIVASLLYAPCLPPQWKKQGLRVNLDLGLGDRAAISRNLGDLM